jgi:Holliday junction resolvasome RuvABC endonuclease subunit
MEENKRRIYLYGLDISLKNTGVAIYDLEDKRFVYIGSFNTEKIRNTKEYKGMELTALKLQKLGEWFESLLEQYPPYFVSIEQMIKKERGKFGVNINEIKAIGKATGVIQRCIWNVPQAFYYPSEVKSAIIKGNAEKELVQTEILKRFPDLEFANLDESDACAVALCQLINVGIIEWDKPVEVKAKRTRKKEGVDVDV